MFQNLPIKDRFGNFRINWSYRDLTIVEMVRAVPFFRCRVNEYTFLAKKKCRSKNTKMEQFAKTRDKLECTSFQNHGGIPSSQYVLLA